MLRFVAYPLIAECQLNQPLGSEIRMSAGGWLLAWLFVESVRAAFASLISPLCYYTALDGKLCVLDSHHPHIPITTRNTLMAESRKKSSHLWIGHNQFVSILKAPRNDDRERNEKCDKFVLNFWTASLFKWLSSSTFVICFELHQLSLGWTNIYVNCNVI